MESQPTAQPAEPIWKRNWFRAAAGVGAIVVLAVGWWLGSPLFLDKEVNEEFPLSASAEIPADQTQASVEKEMTDAAEAPTVEMTEDMPEEGPVALASGVFAGADDFHEGSGRVTLYELEDGSRILRFEDFDVTNGPDLHVLAVPNANPTDRDDLDGYVDLGKLKGNVGNQNYEIPVEVVDIGSVVIYCQPFHVLFATATLA